MSAIRAQEGSGTAQAPGADGVPRLLSFTRLGRSAPGGDAYVVIGIPTAVAFASADRTLTRNLLALGLVGVLAVAAAWVGGNLFIVRRVQTLVRATRRLSAGDLTTRTGLAHGEGELDHLARAFDQMAESLERADERKRLEEELRRKNYELEQQNRAIGETSRLKSEFVSMVSHELRTPLTSIQGYVSLLRDGQESQPPADRRECLAIVQGNADRLLALIDDLLDIARIEAGKIELHRARLDLRPVIHAVAGALRPLLEAKGQRLTLDLDAALPAVWGDGDRVTQILTNLVSNAQKYTPDAGRITVTARAEDGFVRVDVRDTGPGLSPEEQARLFTPFYRVQRPATPTVGGTGLGLSITRSLVELHGGAITVASTLGEGATFSFTLPTAQTALDVPAPAP
ncbi:MAG: HAMP domain-containing sensor histidine kinase, partial [Candidatus Rokuibacteriota bacterium]